MSNSAHCRTIIRYLFSWCYILIVDTSSVHIYDWNSCKHIITAIYASTNIFTVYSKHIRQLVFPAKQTYRVWKVINNYHFRNFALNPFVRDSSLTSDLNMYLLISSSNSRYWDEFRSHLDNQTTTFLNQNSYCKFQPISLAYHMYLPYKANRKRLYKHIIIEFIGRFRDLDDFLATHEERAIYSLFLTFCNNQRWTIQNTTSIFLVRPPSFRFIPGYSFTLETDVFIIIIFIHRPCLFLPQLLKKAIK